MLMIASDRLSDSNLVTDHFIHKPLEDSINLNIESLSLVHHVRTKNSPLHQYLVSLFVESFANKKTDESLPQA